MSLLKQIRVVWIVVLISVMALAASVRLVALGSSALTNDEAYSWRITQYPWQEVVYRTRWDANPPLYYLVLETWECVFGASPWALRGLSVLLALLTVPLTYATCLEAWKLSAKGIGNSAADGLKTRATAAPAALGSQRAGALFGAFLVAVHASQIVPGRTARMYALGVFLAALTSWLLAKSLREQRRPLGWWTSYGLAAAAFALTHYYAFFALAAQGLFAALLLVLKMRHGNSAAARKSAGWLVFAVVLAAGLYAPWLPSLFRQVRDVRQGFWIAQFQPDAAARVFWPWFTGLSQLDSWDRIIWLLVLIPSVGWTVYRRQPAAWLFLLQACLPWICSIALSLLWQRSIFYDRYLSFAQWALLAYWGIVCAGFPGLPVRLLLGLFIGLYGVASCPWPTFPDPPVLAQAAAFLKTHARAGDEVWVSGAAEVNRLRYYCAQSGITDLRVRCPLALGTEGHLVHVAALSGEDFLADSALRNPPPRCWRVGQGVPHGDGSAKAVLEVDFHDHTEGYHLVLYDRGKR